MNSCFVYKHVFPNGKVYIGITSCEPVKRWKNGRGYDNQPIMRNAIMKYGWDNVKHEILAKGLTREEACAMEVALIALYNSTDRNCGYNNTGGGDSYEMTADHKAKISAANKGKPSHLKGKPMSEERKRKIGEANKGKKRTAEQLRKQSEYMKGRCGGENPRSRKVYCVETGIVFNSVVEAAVWTNVSRNSISDALNGRSKQSGGVHWRYLDK